MISVLKVYFSIKEHEYFFFKKHDSLYTRTKVSKEGNE